MAHRNIVQRRPAVEDTQVKDTQVPDGSDQERVLTDADVYRAGGWRVATEPSTLAWGSESSHVSMWAILGLILGVVALCATLTGLLAPEGAAIGVLGFVISIAGVIGSGRPGVNGRGTAALAATIALVAVVLAAIAISGQYSWLNSGTNQVARWHAWLNGHWFG